MRIAGLRDTSLRPLRPTGVFRGDQADIGHQTTGGRKPSRVTQFGRDGQRGEVVDAAEAAEALDAWPEGLEDEEVAQLDFDVTQLALTSSTARR